MPPFLWILCHFLKTFWSVFSKHYWPKENPGDIVISLHKYRCFSSSSVGTPPQSPTLQGGRKAFSNSSTPPKQATISEDIATAPSVPPPPVMDPNGPEASRSHPTSSGAGSDWSAASTNLPQSGQVKERRSISSTRTVVGASAGSVGSGLPPGKPASRYEKL